MVDIAPEGCSGGGDGAVGDTLVEPFVSKNCT